MDRFCVAVAAGAGLCAGALAFSPAALATPFAQGGGASCIEQQAGFGAAPIAAAPVVLPGPVPVAPVVPFVPPVPPVVPPIPPVVPPIVPIAAGAGAAEGVGAAAPITMAAGTGKGAPIATAAAPPAEPVVMPGPALPAAAALPAPEPHSAVLAGTTTAFPACGAPMGPAQ